MCEDVLCPALPWAVANTFTHLQPSFAQGPESSVHEQLDIDTAQSGKQKKMETGRG